MYFGKLIFKHAIVPNAVNQQMFRHLAMAPPSNKQRIAARSISDLDEKVPTVDIDPEGVFKYILVKVYKKNTEDEFDFVKTVVRGSANCKWHSDIFIKLIRFLKNVDLDGKCIGGGRIDHKPCENLIKIYGYSQGYGKADHERTKKIILTKYPKYKFQISDDGY